MPTFANIETFTNLLSSALDEGIFISIHYSNKRSFSTIDKIQCRFLEIKNAPQISSSIFQNDQNYIKNDPPKAFLNNHKEWLPLFKQIILKTNSETIQLLVNKKQKGTLKISTQKNEVINPNHNRSKNYIINEDAPFLHSLGISSSNGKVKEKGYKKFRQINKFVEILEAHLPDEDPKDPMQIYDFGCGKAYLSFAAYYYINTVQKQKVNLLGIDLKSKVIDQVNQVATNLGYDTLRFEVGDITKFQIQKMDVMIALHACDIATDIAIAKAITSNAKLIIMAPCCHKQVRKSLTPSPVSSTIFKHGILEERMIANITDGIRGLILESKGYKVKIFEFISSEHTSKNVMILAEYTGLIKNTQDDINQLKSTFGIKNHYLESLV